ncbi:MAG: isochorismatase family cysteine hydrolase [Pseudomonadota bacterium]
MRPVDADPYPWPLEPLRPEQAALVIIDMQRDFCDPAGYVGQLGHDLGPLRRPIPAIARCLAAARTAGLRVIHTRQGYRPDLADQPLWRRLRAERYGGLVGTPGPLGRVLIRGEPGFQIIEELQPIEGEIVIDKTANGAFTGTELEPILTGQGIRALAFTGNTIDVCVHTSLREANDRGFQPLLIQDACGAIEQGLHAWAVRSVMIEDGVFGSVTTADSFVYGLT